MVTSECRPKRNTSTSLLWDEDYGLCLLLLALSSNFKYMPDFHRRRHNGESWTRNCLICSVQSREYKAHSQTGQKTICQSSKQFHCNNFYSLGGHTILNIWGNK